MLPHPSGIRTARAMLYRLSLMLAALATAITCAVIGPIQPAHAAGSAALADCGPNNPTCAQLSWHNGFIQTHPRVYLVFWGPNWTGESSVVPAMTNIFQHLAGTAYMETLTQYYGSTSDPDVYVHNDVTLAGTWIDTQTPSPGLTMDTIGAEATRAFQFNQVAQGWTNTPNTQVLVFPQHTATYSGFTSDTCGAHNRGNYDPASVGLVYFGVVRYTPDLGNSPCNVASQAKVDMGGIATHEFAEIATDPQADYSGWATGQNEVADLCPHGGQYYDVYTSSNTSTEIYVQPLWDNSAHATTQAAGCVVTHGCDFYSPAAPGRHAVQIPILSAYEGKGAVCNIAPTASTPGVLGYPTTEQYPIAGLHGQTFEHGVIFDTGYSVYDVPSGGAFYTKWAHVGGSTTSLGTLGKPYSNWMSITGGQQQIFTGSDCGAGSSIYWSSATGTNEIHGCINNKYKALGGVTGSMGFPMSDEYGVTDKYGHQGRANKMQGTYCGTTRYGHIWANPGVGYYETNGCIDQKFMAFGGPGSVLGFPKSDEYAIAGGHASDFSGGTCGTSGGGHIYATGNGAGTHEVHGCIAKVFLQQGGPGGWLGFPTSDEYGISIGRESDFQNGYIVYNSSTGVTTAYSYTQPCTPGVPC